MDKLNDLFTKIITKLNKKVDSVEGKQLSTEDFTAALKAKLEDIEDNAQVNTIESISVNGTPVTPDGAKNVNIKAYNEDNKPEVGGRNLVLDSGVEVSKPSYLLTSYKLSEKWDSSQCYSVRIWGKLDSNKDHFIVSGTGRGSSRLNDNKDGTFSAVFYPPDSEDSDWGASSSLNVYAAPNNEAGDSTISKIKLEKGNIFTDWSPAPEDLETTAENFEGILPIEKGGTGSTTGNITREYDNLSDKATIFGFKEAFENKYAVAGSFMSPSGTSRAYIGYGQYPWDTSHNISYVSYPNGTEVGLYKGKEIATADEQKILAQIANRTYQGTDLTVKFKSEIDDSFDGNPWAWIQSRINNANWDGLHVCDYIPFTTTNNVTMQAQIAGMNTYYQYSVRPIPYHIDFICRELWPTLKPVNPVNYNNGISTCEFPWLASDLYHWLNSLSGSVPNAATVNPETTDVDYTTDGVYYFLPANLKAVIVEKHLLLSKRYSASGLLDDDNGWDWKNIGKLWCPTECEVYGMPVWGGKGGYSLGVTALQYPIFTGNMNRVKYRSGSRDYWWLLSPNASYSANWCDVHYNGAAYASSASNTSVAAPVCFRIASTVKTADMPEHEPEIMGDEYLENETEE